MSAFKVYGVSWPVVREHVRKEFIRESEIKRQPIMWNQAQCEEVDARTDAAFNSAKPCAISDAFDAPQFAFAWIETAKKTTRVRDLQVWGHYPVCDANGTHQTNDKGRPLYRWEPYSEGKLRANG